MEMQSPQTKDQQAPQVLNIVEHLFRHESGKMVAILTGIFGLNHLTLAEDVVQEALARALQTWPFYGVPENPSAWIMRTSRNLALDVVRREKVFRDKEPEIVRLMDREGPVPDSVIFPEQEIADDRLRMMFVCCHPLIPPEAQVALALKTLGGFSVTEISRAFLTSDAAIAKRLTRAKQRFVRRKLLLKSPPGEELGRRLDGVLHSLYLLFNEGYKASSGEKLIREDVCAEAIRLTGLLAEHPSGNVPKTHALLALMLFSTARLPARVDGEGNLLRLQEQDRALWNQPMIARGILHLTKSSGADELSEYHLQAGIAACHSMAPDYASTDWRQILALYDRLSEFDASPIVALNRAVAIAEVDGPQAGIESIRAIPDLPTLDSYYLLHAVLGEFELRLNRPGAAAVHFRKSLELAEMKSEQVFLQKRLRACEENAHKKRLEPVS